MTLRSGADAPANKHVSPAHINPRLAPTATVPVSFSATTIMSAAQKVQNHPAFIQAQNKANFYAGQLDKEASLARTKSLFFF